MPIISAFSKEPYEDTRLNRLRVLLVHDHESIVDGMRALVSAVPAFVVTGEVAGAPEALQVLERTGSDLVLIAVARGELDGMIAVEQVASRVPSIPVLIVTADLGREFVLAAMHAGALGSVRVAALPAEFEAAARTVAAGHPYVGPPVVERPPVAGPSDKTRDAVTLTPRHREILRLIADGLTTRQVAERLGISVKTADAHRTEMMRRLDIHDLASLVRYAIRAGLVPLQP